MSKDEWCFICPKCGSISPIRHHGGVRIGAASVGKRVLGFCSECGRIPGLGIGRPRMLRVAKVPVNETGAARD